MAYVFQTFDKVTGKAHPKWKYRVIDFNGRRKTATGCSSRTETEKMAAAAEARAARIKVGLEAVPTSAHKNRHKPFDEIRGAYLKWGESQGGRGGRPWSKGHAHMRRALLTWWGERLGLSALIDLDGILSRAEEALRELQASELAGKTVQNHAECLKSFCRWCVTRGFLQRDPLAGLAPFDTTPETTRRALTQDEVKALLNAAPENHRLVYEVALCSGLRANELRCLAVDDLDATGGGLRLQAEWTKNRKPGFQPLPAALVKRLQAFVSTGAAKRSYAASMKRKDATLQVPENPLLSVPSHCARDFDSDCKAAKIKKNAPGGKVDFHSLRVTFISRVLESGCGVKEAMSLARHASPNLTLNVYGRTSEGRLAAIAEAVGGLVLTPEIEADSTARAQLKATGTEDACATSGYGEQDRGSNPVSSTKSENEPRKCLYARTCGVRSFKGEAEWAKIVPLRHCFQARSCREPASVQRSCCGFP